MAKAKAWFTDDVKRQKFLTAIRNGASVLQACDASGFAFATVDGWLREDDRIRLDIERAKEMVPAVEASREQNKPVVRDEKTGVDRWRKLKEDAARFAPGMLGFLFAVDARVSARPGNPPMSEFFRHEFSAFYRGGYREFCMCGARGSGKSTNQIKVASTELIARDRHIPPMDPPWIWPFMSHNMAESAKRFVPFKDTLIAAGFAASELDTVEREDGRAKIKFHDIKGQRVEVNIFPNTKEACVGGNLAGATHDEELHWQSGETSSKVKLSRADDVLEFQAGAFRSDLTRVHIRISALSGMNGPLLDAVKNGSTELRYVPTLGPFLELALEGFARVMEWLDKRGLHDDARRVRSWASRLKPNDPWIPAWVGNPSHDAVDGLRLVLDLLPSWRDKIGVWLRENGSCTDPLRPESGDFFVDKKTTPPTDLIARAVIVPRIVTKSYDGRFAAIDTGATFNPSALCIVERVTHEIRLGGTKERRYQWRPVHFQKWSPVGGPLDLRGVVLPQMAAKILSMGCVPAWWSDGWSGDAVQIVGSEKGIHTRFISTSTVTSDQYDPLFTALAQDPCPVALTGCEHADEAVAQLRQVRRSNDGKAIVPHAGTEHGELGQVLVRALAHAGVGTMPPDDEQDWESGGSDRDDGCSGGSRYE